MLEIEKKFRIGSVYTTSVHNKQLRCGILDGPELQKISTSLIENLEEDYRKFYHRAQSKSKIYSDYRHDLKTRREFAGIVKGLDNDGKVKMAVHIFIGQRLIDLVQAESASRLHGYKTDGSVKAMLDHWFSQEYLNWVIESSLYEYLYPEGNIDKWDFNNLKGVSLAWWSYLHTKCVDVQPYWWSILENIASLPENENIEDEVTVSTTHEEVVILMRHAIGWVLMSDQERADLRDMGKGVGLEKVELDEEAVKIETVALDEEGFKDPCTDQTSSQSQDTRCADDTLPGEPAPVTPIPEEPAGVDCPSIPEQSQEHASGTDSSDGKDPSDPQPGTRSAKPILRGDTTDSGNKDARDTGNPNSGVWQLGAGAVLLVGLTWLFLRQPSSKTVVSVSGGMIRRWKWFLLTLLGIISMVTINMFLSP